MIKKILLFSVVALLCACGKKSIEGAYSNGKCYIVIVKEKSSGMYLYSCGNVEGGEVKILANDFLTIEGNTLTLTNMLYGTKCELKDGDIMYKDCPYKKIEPREGSKEDSDIKQLTARLMTDYNQGNFPTGFFVAKPKYRY